MSGRAVLDKAMTEAQLFESVRAHLRAFGWLWYHTFDSRRSNGGFPDITAVHGDGMGNTSLIFIELKRENGVLTDAQLEWFCMLDHAGGEDGTPYGARAYVWRPSDLSSGEIERVLRSGGVGK